jgi:predicted  nucleic acid-binding Zn-ribbon protein
MDAELNRLNAERVGVAACVTDAPLLQRYESLRARPACAGVAVARIVEKHCSGCGNQVSSNDADKVREAAVVITCETCSRILAIVE